MPMKIVITSLSMRFYMKYGWSCSLLNKYVNKGRMEIMDLGNYEEYYIAPPYTTLNILKLVKDGFIGELVGKESWSELKDMTDLEILNDRNW